MKFWTNNRVKGGTLIELIEGPLQQMEGNKAVKDMFRDEEWKWNEFSFELPSNVKEKISATPFQLFGNKDTLIWKVTKHGEFSSATTYTLARPEEDQETAFLGKRV